MGSRTRDSFKVKGIWEHSLTTRPINDLMGKVKCKEEELLKSGSLPRVVICGAGAAGVELAFGFKARWSKLFGCQIEVAVIAASDSILKGANPAVVDITYQKLKKHEIEVVHNTKIAEINEEGVVLPDGVIIPANVVIWATGAEPQMISADSDLKLADGYFLVNDFL